MTLIIKTTGWADYLGDEGAYIKALIMGPPGAGKTRSASFWPKPIFADCEKGRMSIADRGVPYAEIRSSEQMNALLDLLKAECRKGPDRKYHTLVVDTLDSYQRTVIHERLVSEKKEALSGWADWGHLDAKMTQFVEKVLNLPMNIVVNLHVKEISEGDSESKLVTVGPKLKGDMREQIAAEFDLVGYMAAYWGVENGERTLRRGIRWAPDPRYPILKDRSGRLPRFTDVDFTDNDFTAIFQAIVGDHVDEFPETTVIEEIGDEPVDVAPAGPDVKGGPVATAKDFPRTKADKKEKPAPTPDPGPPVIEVDATAVPPVDTPADPAVVQEDDPTTPVVVDEEPEDSVTEPEAEPEKEVISPDKKADEPKREAQACGSQPARLVGKSDPAEGCGKSLEGEPKDRVNIALLRTNTFLCNECFQTWKNSN